MSTVMGNSPIGAVAKIPMKSKASARVALVDIDGAAGQVLADCFRQFGVEPVALNDNAPHRLQWEKFEACVVKLRPEFQPVMESARCSPSNNRMVIYGLGGSAQEALQYSKYGVNAVFSAPVDRPAALKVVRATQMLVLHEFRRYVRIPIVTQVELALGGNERFTATSREISVGGMSLVSAQDVVRGSQVEISFALLTLPRIWVRGTISWRKPKSFGVRFDTGDNRRLRIKTWVEGYLEC
jgi:PilZ domain